MVKRLNLVKLIRFAILHSSMDRRPRAYKEFRKVLRSLGAPKRLMRTSSGKNMEIHRPKRLLVKSKPGLGVPGEIDFRKLERF